MTTTSGMTIAIGSDDAGIDYKAILAADLVDDARVASVIDVGVGPDEHTHYPMSPLRPPVWWPTAPPTGPC